MGKHQQGSLGGAHPQVDSRHLGYRVAPDAAGVHRDGGVVVVFFCGDAVAGVHSAHRRALDYQMRHFGVQQHAAAAQFGVQHIGGAQSKGVHAAVGHPHRPGKIGVHGGLQPSGKLRCDDFCRDAGLTAFVHEGLLVAEVIFRQGYEQAVCLLYAV